MPRPPRAQFDGALYYLIVRASHRQLLFRDDRDCVRYLVLLRRYRHQFGCRVYAYLLANRQVELVLETPKGNIGKVMQCLGTSYAAYYNHRYRRKGALFEGRYRSYLVDRDNHLLEATRRVHRSASCGDAKVNKEYPWTSYGVYLGKTRSDLVQARTVLSHFGQTTREQQAGYRKFVDGEGMGRVELLERLKAYPVGSSRKRTAAASKDQSSSGARDILREAYARLGLADVGDWLRTDFAGRRIKSLVRHLAMYLIRRETALPLHSIGELFGVKAPAVALAIRKWDELLGAKDLTGREKHLRAGHPGQTA